MEYPLHPRKFVGCLSHKYHPFRCNLSYMFIFPRKWRLYFLLSDLGKGWASLFPAQCKSIMNQPQQVLHDLQKLGRTCGANDDSWLLPFQSPDLLLLQQLCRHSLELEGKLLSRATWCDLLIFINHGSCLYCLPWR